MGDPPDDQGGDQARRHPQRELAGAGEDDDERGDGSNRQGGGGNGHAQVATVDETVVEDEGERGGHRETSAGQHAGTEAENLRAQGGDDGADGHPESGVDQREGHVAERAHLGADA
jgi:hypothetical protein